MTRLARSRRGGRRVPQAASGAKLPAAALDRPKLVRLKPAERLLADGREAAQEIRLQAQRYGLSPMDRRRLQWEIERADEAQARGHRRAARQVGSGSEPRGRLVDPRAILRPMPTGDEGS